MSGTMWRVLSDLKNAVPFMFHEEPHVDNTDNEPGEKEPLKHTDVRPFTFLLLDDLRINSHVGGAAFILREK